ncbi:hypothetical protein CJ030_MR5G020829 [Morella rubra]|uniref:Uncharacterized protein n=1 Tax=Morella rubra TaxID=262757 RepID=A0A6A1VS59_9ROSI|nr:hypothetical protein CJ030_MR5G020829 [Morella rubra]
MALNSIISWRLHSWTSRDARSVFAELFNLVPRRVMIVGYKQSGYPIEALELFADEKWAELLPNSGYDCKRVLCVWEFKGEGKLVKSNLKKVTYGACGHGFVNLDRKFGWMDQIN